MANDATPVVASPPSDSTSGSSDAHPAESKKRKSTYYTRKEEIEQLKAEIKTLQESLQLAERAALVGSVDPLQIMDSAARAAFYDKSIERNNLKLAGTQAMLSSYNMNVGRTSSSTIPLKSYVHLPADKQKRDEIIRAMHLEKLRTTYQFMDERTRGMDLSVEQGQRERFDFPDGTTAVIGFDVTHFTTGHSLRQVYDAFMFYIGNQEISMSTELGMLTIRESEEDMGNTTYSQTRFLTSLPEGLEIESNAVMFAALVEKTDTKPGFGLGFVEFVDKDDLHPYRPDVCGRRDMTATVRFTEIPNVDGAGPPTVVVSRWAHVRFLPPSFPLSKELEKAVREGITKNDSITFQVMRDRLAFIQPNGVA